MDPFNVDDLAQAARTVSSLRTIVETVLAYNPDASTLAHCKLFEGTAAPNVGADTPYLSIPVPPGATVPIYLGRSLVGLHLAATTEFGPGATAPASALTVAVTHR